MISQSGVTIARPIRTSPIGSHGLLLSWKILIAQAALFISSIPATAAETWLCTFPGLISSMAVKERLEVRATEVIRDGQTAYRIVQNNDRSVIATYARTQPADAAITVGTLAIDKPTGDFVISVMVPGAPLMSKVVTGKCQLDR